MHCWQNVELVTVKLVVHIVNTGLKVAGNNKTYSGLDIKCQIFKSVFNQILEFLYRLL